MHASNDVFLYLFIPAFIMFLYGLVVALLLASLTVFHTFLIAKNETTQEDMREKYAKWGGNPYDQGAWSKTNLMYFLVQ
jgi:hypothetical protein